MTRKQYWLTPADTYAALDAEFKFDFDPCPYPRPQDFNGIEVPWGKVNYVNPPFRRSDGAFGAGPTAFVRKAIAEQQSGNSSVSVLPTMSFINLLLNAGAELRPMGRIPWIETTSRKQCKNSSNVTAFILRGKK
ncbi:MAG: hypothetical protein ABSC54_00690 [Smithellaceae bacterium]|jgi:hypothetical protein